MTLSMAEVLFHKLGWMEAYYKDFCQYTMVDKDKNKLQQYLDLHNKENFTFWKRIPLR